MQKILLEYFLLIINDQVYYSAKSIKLCGSNLTNYEVRWILIWGKHGH